eukprot:g1500.t1
MKQVKSKLDIYEKLTDPKHMEEHMKELQRIQLLNAEYEIQKCNIKRIELFHKQELEAKKEEHKKLEDKINRKQLQLRKQETKVETLEKKLKLNQKNLRMSQDVIKEHEASLKGMKRRILTVRDPSHMKNKMNHTHGNTQNTIATMENKVNALKKENERLQKEIKRLKFYEKLNKDREQHTFKLIQDWLKDGWSRDGVEYSLDIIEKAMKDVLGHELYWEVFVDKILIDEIERIHYKRKEEEETMVDE